MDRRGGFVDRREAPVLRAHGAALVASLVVLEVRHDGHQLALQISLRSRASSDTSSLLAVHLKNKKVRKSQSSHLRLRHSHAVLLFTPADTSHAAIHQTTRGLVGFSLYRTIRHQLLLPTEAQSRRPELFFEAWGSEILLISCALVDKPYFVFAMRSVQIFQTMIIPDIL